jgi:hypothetical protein
MNANNMNQLSDLFTIFLLNNNKQNLMEELMEKFGTIFIKCTKENDDYWNECASFLANKLADVNKNTKAAFYRKLFPILRQFLNSGISDSNVRDSTSGGDSSRGEPKKFKVNAKCFHLTYDNTQDITLDQFMEQIFIIFSGKIKKWAVAHDVAPTTGMIHYYLYLELFEAWKVLDARKKFKIIDSKDVEIIPNIKTGGGTKEAIAYIAKKEIYKTNMDMHYELKTKKLHQQLVAYELIQGKTNVVEATEMYPELLFKYDSLKSNLNSFKYDREMFNNPGNPLLEWNMFGIQTWFSGDGKTPQYWIVGPSNVGKTYNIDTLEGSGHRAYLMSKENDWSDYNDNDYDFMYNEETGADYKLTFLNQLLEGTRTKLNGKYVKSITKRKNMPMILNSNYMPHMLYKNTSLYDLAPTLNRMYIIYVDKQRRGHIIWNPEIMDIEAYASLFMNNEMPIENYEGRFSNEFINESHTEKSYIKYQTTFEKEEREEIERRRKELEDIVREGEILVEEAKKKKREEAERKKREQNDSMLNAINEQNITSNGNNTTNTLVDDDVIINTSDSDNIDSSSSDSDSSEIDYGLSTSEPIKRKKRKNKRRRPIMVKQAKNLTPWLDKFNEISLNIDDISLDSSTEEINEIVNGSDTIEAVSGSDQPKFSDRFKKIVDNTTGKDLEREMFDKWVAKRRKNKDQT